MPFQSTLGDGPLEAVGLETGALGLTVAALERFAPIGFVILPDAVVPRAHRVPGLTRLSDERWTQRMGGVSSIDPWLAHLMAAETVWGTGDRATARAARVEIRAPRAFPMVGRLYAPPAPGASLGAGAPHGGLT